MSKTDNPAAHDLCEKLVELARWHYEKYLYHSRKKRLCLSAYHLEQSTLVRQAVALLEGKREKGD